MGSRPPIARFAGVVALVALTAACGGGASTPTTGEVEEIRFTATDLLRFEPEEMTLRPGSYRIVFANDSSIVHQLALSEAGEHGHGAHDLGDTGDVPAGETASFTTTLKEGSYEYACHVDGHDKAGMIGRLTVR